MVLIQSIKLSMFSLTYRCREIILHILSVFSQTTLRFFNNDFNQLTQNPHLVEDFYDLCGRTIESQPELLFSSPDMLLQIVQVAIIGIQVQHREANSSVIRFIISFLQQGDYNHHEEGDFALNFQSYRSILESILQNCGQELMNQLVTIFLSMFN